MKNIYSNKKEQETQILLDHNLLFSLSGPEGRLHFWSRGAMSNKGYKNLRGKDS